MYFLVELCTGLLFLLIAVKEFSIGMPPPMYLKFALELVFWCTVFSAVLYDLKHTIIPNMWSLTAAVLAVLISFLSVSGGDLRSFYFSLLSGLIFFGFFFILWLISLGRWMGLGDAKLAFSLGVFIGLNKLFSAWALSFWIGAIVMLFYMLLDRFFFLKGKTSPTHDHREITLKTEIPFGPFLFIGTFLAYLGIVIPINGI